MKGDVGLRRKISSFDRLILFLSVASIRRILLKANNVASTQLEKVAIHDSDRKKINLILIKSFRYHNLIY